MFAIRPKCLVNAFQTPLQSSLDVLCEVIIHCKQLMQIVTHVVSTWNTIIAIEYSEIRDLSLQQARLCEVSYDTDAVLVEYRPIACVWVCWVGFDQSITFWRNLSIIDLHDCLFLQIRGTSVHCSVQLYSLSLPTNGHHFLRYDLCFNACNPESSGTAL